MAARTDPNQIKELASQVARMRSSLRTNSAAPRGSPSPSQKKNKPGPGNVIKTDVPAAFGTTSNNLVRTSTLKSTADAIVMRGTTILGSIMVGANASMSLPNVALYSPSNPVTFEDRMQVIASTYDKYVYNWVKLRYIPQCSTSTSGLVILAIDRDYTDIPSTTSLATAQSYEAVCMGSAFASHTCMIKRDTHERRTYFVSFGNDVNIRESEQFKFYCFTSGVAAGTPIGQLVLDYEIQLISPIYAPPELSSSLATLGVTASYAQVPLFAASSNLCNFPFLPLTSSGIGQMFELIFQAPTSSIVTAVPLTFGVGGPAYAPNTPSGSVTLYVVGSSGAGTRNYHVYADYNTAVRGGIHLHNPSVIASGIFTTTVAVTSRPLTYTSPTN